MNPTTESRLITGINQHNSTAYAAFVTGHLGMVFALAKKHCNGDSAEVFNDLVGEGKLALCEAAKEFPPKRLPCKFSTYVHIRINRAMVSLRRSDNMIQGSEWSVRMAQKARRNWDELVQFFEHEEGHAPTAEDFSFVFGEQQEQALDPLRIIYGDAALESDIYSSALDSSCAVYRRTANGSQMAVAPALVPWAWRQGDVAFSERFERLPRDTRLLIDQLARQYDSTGGVSLAAIATQWHCDRGDLVDTFQAILNGGNGH